MNVQQVQEREKIPELLQSFFDAEIGADGETVFIFDMDGCLCALGDDPLVTIVQPEILNFLTKLAELENVSVNISTGRDIIAAVYLLSGVEIPLGQSWDQLEPKAKELAKGLEARGIYVQGGHGAQGMEILLNPNRSAREMLELTDQEKSDLDRVAELKKVLNKEFGETFGEDKVTSQCEHAKRITENGIEPLSKEDEQKFNTIVSNFKQDFPDSIVVKEDPGQFEFVVRKGTSKAQAVDAIRKRLQGLGKTIQTAIAIGDAKTDKDTFDRLSKLAPLAGFGFFTVKCNNDTYYLNRGKVTPALEANMEIRQEDIDRLLSTCLQLLSPKPEGKTMISSPENTTTTDGSVATPGLTALNSNQGPNVTR